MAKPVQTKPVAPLKKPAVVVSFEGVIASSAWRSEFFATDYERWAHLTTYDAPNPAFVEAMKMIADDVKLVILSDVQTDKKLLVEDWLADNGITYWMLHCRYNNNFHTSDTVKATVFKQMVGKNYDVGLILEADPACWEMWHAEGHYAKFIADPGLEPIGVPDPDAILEAIHAPCHEWLYPSPSGLRCDEPTGHTGPHHSSHQCPTMVYGAKCVRTKGHHGEHNYELGAPCGQPVGGANSETKCNMTKGHGGTCKWSNVIDARRWELEAREAFIEANQHPQDRLERLTAGPIALGPAPAPLADPESHEVLAPIADGPDVCNAGASDGRICVRTAGHEGQHAFASPEVAAVINHQPAIEGWAGPGGWNEYDGIM